MARGRLRVGGVEEPLEEERLGSSDAGTGEGDSIGEIDGEKLVPKRVDGVETSSKKESSSSSDARTGECASIVMDRR